jgi:U1 small nuclear ribonucleoprotein 70kDa
VQTVKERRLKKKTEALALHNVRIKGEISKYRASHDSRGLNGDLTEDAYNTVFVAHLPYDIKEEEVKLEFEGCGPVKCVKLIQNMETSKGRGYAFVEFVEEDDAITAVETMHDKRFGSRRLIVDVERHRTVPDWCPRRLGGGVGEGRSTRPPRDPFQPCRRQGGKTKKKKTLLHATNQQSGGSLIQMRRGPPTGGMGGATRRERGPPGLGTKRGHEADDWSTSSSSHKRGRDDSYNSSSYRYDYGSSNRRGDDYRRDDRRGDDYYGQGRRGGDYRRDDGDYRRDSRGSSSQYHRDQSRGDYYRH